MIAAKDLARAGDSAKIGGNKALKKASRSSKFFQSSLLVEEVALPAASFFCTSFDRTQAPHVSVPKNYICTDIMVGSPVTNAIQV